MPLLVVCARVRELDRVVESRKRAGFEPEVDHGPDPLDDSSLVHDSLASFDIRNEAACPRAGHGCYPLSASAPPMISISSLVMEAWRPRVIWSRRREIMSTALV